MRLRINFSLRLSGLAERLVEYEEDDLFSQGLGQAIEKSREEIRINFIVGGRPKWDLTQDGRIPLVVTGKLMEACSDGAIAEKTDEGFELSAPDGDRDIVAAVQDARYNIFTLPEEAQKNVAEAFEVGVMED